MKGKSAGPPSPNRQGVVGMEAKKPSQKEVDEKQRLLKEKLNKLKGATVGVVKVSESNSVPDVSVKSFEDIMREKKQKKKADMSSSKKGLEGSLQSSVKARLSPVPDTRKSNKSPIPNDVQVKSFEEIMKEKKMKKNKNALVKGGVVFNCVGKQTKPPSQKLLRKLRKSQIQQALYRSL